VRFLDWEEQEKFEAKARELERQQAEEEERQRQLLEAEEARLRQERAAEEARINEEKRRAAVERLAPVAEELRRQAALRNSRLRSRAVYLERFRQLQERPSKKS
jgi:hypothetical protein